MERMWLSRVRLRPGAAEASRFWERGGADPLGHHTVWSLFAGEPAGSRPFLYRQEGSGTRASFFVLSERPPADQDGLWEIESKELRPALEAGQLLSFSLRASPAIRRGRREGDGESEQGFVGKRIDVVMDAKLRARERGESKSSEELVHTACLSWLSAKGERCGFSLLEESFLAEGYQQHRLPRRGKAPATFSTVDMSGTLRVTDVERFLATMAQGIGPEKAFGCGLLLVRRA